ncbi:TPA_asm: hypothetical protein [Coelastrella green algae MELD virus]|nr:TPA_asm: hypothetical protein [Coelastrella green algae MELD virus]
MPFFQGIHKAFGRVGHVLKRIGQAGINFVRTEHQPLAMLAHGIGEASGHPALKRMGDFAMMGSSLATLKGHGKNYFAQQHAREPYG